MHKRAAPIKSFSGRMLIGIGVLACLALGVIGLVLPVIPGLLFLALAVILIARHVPWVDGRLRAHGAIGPHMHRADRFFTLGFVDKLRVAGLVGVKGLCDAFDRIGAAIARRRPDSRAR